MTDRILRLPELIDTVGLSRRTIYRRMEAGKFPQSTKLGENAVGWRESEILVWMKAPMAWKPED